MNDIFQIEKQSKGASCAYHTGFLAIDRSEDNARVSQRQRVDAVAKEAYRLYARGLAGPTGSAMGWFVVVRGRKP